jgi:TRAP-type C4-dicarboxylate transport system substrate-binding protein|tara:strand:+ start:277 stop:447 length:171 start_codon:yes stop_codon:yes gene_type:complete
MIMRLKAAKDATTRILWFRGLKLQKFWHAQYRNLVNIKPFDFFGLKIRVYWDYEYC